MTLLYHDQYLATQEGGFPDGTSHCDRCGCETSTYKIMDDRRICPDCETEYLNARITPALIDNFIEADPDRKYAFYVEILSDSITASEREQLRRIIADVAKILWDTRAQLPEEREYLDEQKVVFCMDELGFYDYLEAAI